MLKKRYIRILIFALYNLFAVILLFICAEILVRITIPNIQPQGISANIIQNNMIYDSNRLKPNSYGLCNGEIVFTDQYGFRACQTPIDHRKVSWLLLGDSVTMGVGAHSDSTFAARLQSQLDSVNILNSGVIGYSYHDYRNLVKYYIEEKNIDLQINRILLFFCLNDIYHTMSDIEQPGGKFRFLFGGVLSFLRTNSRLYVFLKNTISDRAKSYYLFDEQFYNSTNKHFRKCLDTLQEMQTILNQYDIQFDIIMLPYEYQLRKAYSPTVIPQKFLTDALREQNISVYDSLDYFTQYQSDSKALYLFADGIHFSDYGHYIISNYIRDQILLSKSKSYSSYH